VNLALKILFSKQEQPHIRLILGNGETAGLKQKDGSIMSNERDNIMQEDRNLAKVAARFRRFDVVCFL
jgi:hypothetical protein